jgi:hypothetical protein
LRVAWFSAVSVFIVARERSSMGSGGIGSVAVGVIVVPYLLLALASIVANRMLVGWARRSDRFVKIVHAANSWSIVLAFVVVVASVVGINAGGPPLPFVLLPLSGVVWGVHFLLAATLLGTYAVRTA